MKLWVPINPSICNYRQGDFECKGAPGKRNCGSKGNHTRTEISDWHFTKCSSEPTKNGGRGSYLFLVILAQECSAYKTPSTLA